MIRFDMIGRLDSSLLLVPHNGHLFL